ncbi:hypothetical protein MFRU_011g01650 [Monilinia fructicola]|nr:hypothetical protein MFRU_011g01650 [Monilinia fructicola]
MDKESGLRATGVLKGIWRTDSWEREGVERLDILSVQEARPLIDADPLGEDLEIHSLDEKRWFLRSTIWDSSKDLETFIKGNSVDLLNTLPSSTWAATAVAMRLREWLECNECTFLWIQGEADHKYPSDLSVLAGSVIDASTTSKTPIIFHFCEPIKKSDQREGLSLEQACAISLVYALIRQLIGLLAPEIDGEIDLSPSRFSPLKKPLESWKDALSLLVDLLTLAPGVLLCAIDGFEYIDYGKGKSMCSDILTVLNDRKSLACKDGVVFKTLFTTAGSSRTLDNYLGTDETVFNAEPRRQSYGRAGPGQRSFLH